MKQFLTFCIITLLGITAGAQNFKVTLQAPQYKSGIAFLTYHMGKNLNIEDSAAMSINGTAIFTAKRKLLPGVYAVVLPGKRISIDFFATSGSMPNCSFAYTWFLTLLMTKIIDIDGYIGLWLILGFSSYFLYS